MCGIVGIAGSGAADQQNLAAVRTALERMRNRGPDGEGIWSGNTVVFGHRRLAVLDPSGGRQPWVDDASGVVLTYNGELYNFQALRVHLQGKGREFRSRCDTEVVLRAYLEWGEDCVERFEGMFAFAVYDPRDGRVRLFRDRLGVKPLFHARTPEGFAFASSVSALLAFPGIERRLDVHAASHYFQTIRTTLERRTLLRGVESLEPGCILGYHPKTGVLRVKRYWRLPVLAEEEKERREFGEACRETRRRIDAAVAGQVVSDVPLGGFFSGGIDSCVLTASAVAARDGRFETHSVGYDRRDYEEWDFVREGARHYGIRAEELHLPEDGYGDDWRALIREKGLPLSTPNEVPIYRLARAFRKRMTVALTGEGADELFGGYLGPHFSGFDFDRAVGGGVDSVALQRFYGKDSFASRREHYFLVNSWISAEQKRVLFAPGIHAELQDDRTIRDYYDGLFADVEKCDTIEAHLHVHARINLEGLLYRLDSSTMAASVEGRVPFTDHGLAEWLFRLPREYKVALGRESDRNELPGMNSFEIGSRGWVDTKRLLRTGFADCVPQSILQRPKMSFPVPFIPWFSGPMLAECRERIAGSPLAAQLLSDAGRDACLTGNPVNPLLLWPLTNLCLWEDAWDVRF